MNESILDQLDESITALLAGDESIAAPLAGKVFRATHNSQLRDLLQIASQLHAAPRPEFRRRLRDELEQSATGLSVERRASSPVEAAQSRISSEPRYQTKDRNTILPPLFLTGPSTLPIRGYHLAISFALHVAALAVIISSGWWMVQNRQAVRTKVAQLIPTSDDYLLPVAPGALHGGGGGGDRDILPASHGAPPRFAAQQLAPPAVVVRNENPKLPVEPTVVGPPDLVLSASDKFGDPMANILNPPSNGPGSGGGIGSGHGGGVGSGEGPGVGAGIGGGIGGGIYRVGGGVSAPRPIYDPDPEYSDEARKAKFQGTVLLVAVIGPDGRPRDLRVLRSLGMGLDQKALDAVRTWRFAPAMKGNQPVSVLISIEVAFRLY
jgi:periplasmic protein TonB